ncbi:LysR family transcriptional regulator [Thiofilum flexile]|uniref:LysR family transcriptional regulator n=1 Tax=Thiofilum flexile TaxID=125627 RepID=UPI00036F2C08|nr:LysR family transcriptional regulator [Thiofilum flexile]
MRNKQIIDFLKDITIFTMVVEHKSFTKAAEKLGMTTAAMSRCVRRLEQNLGQRLINRDTRNFNTTEAGDLIYQKGGDILNLAQECFSISEQLSNTPQGKITISAPKAFSKWILAPLIPSFLKQYPNIQINLIISDELLDIKNDLDLIIQISENPNTKLVSIPLMKVEHTVCASHKYLEAYGHPQHPIDLKNHECLSLGESTQDYWTFIHKKTKESIRVEINARYTINHSESRLEGILQDLGIGHIPHFVAQEAVETNQVLTLLQDWKVISPYQGIAWLMYEFNSSIPYKIRLFIDYLKQNIK